MDEIRHLGRAKESMISAPTVADDIHRALEQLFERRATEHPGFSVRVAEAVVRHRSAIEIVGK